MVTQKTGNDRLTDLLAAYGSDISRWPADGRAAFQSLPPQERSELMRDDAALDRLLQHAAQAAAEAAPPDDLMARIVAAAPDRDPAPDREQGARIVSLRQPDPATVEADVRPARAGRDWAAAAALMAASLVLGVFVGSTDSGQVAARSLGAVAGFEIASSSLHTTVLDEALQSQDDEDIL